MTNVICTMNEARQALIQAGTEGSMEMVDRCERLRIVRDGWIDGLSMAGSYRGRRHRSLDRLSPT